MVVGAVSGCTLWVVEQLYDCRPGSTAPAPFRYRVVGGPTQDVRRNASVSMSSVKSGVKPGHVSRCVNPSGNWGE